MESIQKKAKPAQVYKPQTVEATPIPDTSDAHEAANQAIGKVEIIHGAYQDSYEVAGKTVGYIRENLGDVYSIPPDAECLIDGNVVSDEFVLKANSTVEFIKASGTKG
jgi:hypothetical protein